MFLRLYEHSGTEIYNNLENSTYNPLKYKVDSPILNCIKMYGKIHENARFG